MTIANISQSFEARHGRPATQLEQTVLDTEAAVTRARAALTEIGIRERADQARGNVTATEWLAARGDDAGKAAGRA